jgi:transcriptional regulator with XRE-family HTH domain
MFVGSLLRERRMELELTEQHVADFVGCSRASITHWEKDDVAPNANYLQKISIRLGVSMEYFFDDLDKNGSKIVYTTKLLNKEFIFNSTEKG